MHVHRHIRELREQQINEPLIQHLRLLAYTSLLPPGTDYLRPGERHSETERSREREKGRAYEVVKRKVREERDLKQVMNFLLVHSSLLFFILYSSFSAHSSSCPSAPFSSSSSPPPSLVLCAPPHPLLPLAQHPVVLAFHLLLPPSPPLHPLLPLGHLLLPPPLHPLQSSILSLSLSPQCSSLSLLVVDP